MSSQDEDRVRTLLEDAVADVEPRYAARDILSRTSPGRRRWVRPVGGAVVATAAVLVAVAGLGGLGGLPGLRPDRPAGPTDPDPGFTGHRGTSPQRSTAGGAAGTPVYLVGRSGSGPRLFRESHPAASGAPLDRAMTDAASGTALDPDYGTPWPDGTVVRSSRVADGSVTVDLTGAPAARPAGMSAATATLALQQLVYTAQDSSATTTPVTFLLDGRPTSTLLGVGTARPVPRASEDQTLAPVSIAAPGQGATVRSPFTVTGRASTFEGNVQWRLVRDGRVVRRGFTTARACCTLSPYSLRVSAPPGRYTLVVHDEDVSGGEGVGPSQDTKAITVR